MRSEEGLDLLVTVTLNDNQLASHLLPILALPEVRSAVLVADRAGPPLPKLTTVVPPRTLRLFCGRAFSKLVLCLRIAKRQKPDVLIAYNLVPHALNAAVVARATGAPAVFHMIGGPEEWLGGGWLSDNNVLSRLRRPSRTLERLLLRVIRRFDVVATMGPAGADALAERGVDRARIVELPAAVDIERFRAARAEEAAFDVVAVTSLIPRKRPHDILGVLAELSRTQPTLRAAILGTGPLLPELRLHADRLGLTDTIEFLGFRANPEEVVASSRVFLLASRQEGLSIAITEAMAAGVPPVVTRVGEIESLISDGENGYLWEVGDVESAARRVAELLQDEELRQRMGDAAARSAAERFSHRAISDKSREMLRRAIAQ